MACGDIASVPAFKYEHITMMLQVEAVEAKQQSYSTAEQSLLSKDTMLTIVLQSLQKLMALGQSCCLLIPSVPSKFEVQTYEVTLLYGSKPRL